MEKSLIFLSLILSLRAQISRIGALIITNLPKSYERIYRGSEREPNYINPYKAPVLNLNPYDHIINLGLTSIFN